MIYKKGTRYPTTDIYVIYQGELRTLLAIHKGQDLIWQRISSCYGTGIWLPNRPWLDGDKWKDHR